MAISHAHHFHSLAASIPQMPVAIWACPDGTPKEVSLA